MPQGQCLDALREFAVRNLVAPFLEDAADVMGLSMNRLVGVKTARDKSSDSVLSKLST